MSAVFTITGMPCLFLSLAIRVSLGPGVQKTERPSQKLSCRQLGLVDRDFGARQNMRRTAYPSSYIHTFVYLYFPVLRHWSKTLPLL